MSIAVKIQGFPGASITQALSPLRRDTQLIAAVLNPEYLHSQFDETTNTNQITFRERGSKASATYRICTDAKTSRSIIEVMGVAPHTITGAKASILARITANNIEHYEQRRGKALIYTLKKHLLSTTAYTALDGLWEVDPANRCAIMHHIEGTLVQATYRATGGWKIQTFSKLSGKQCAGITIPHFESPLRYYFEGKYQSARILEEHGRGSSLPSQAVMLDYDSIYHKALAELEKSKAPAPARSARQVSSITTRQLLQDPESVAIHFDREQGDYTILLGQAAGYLYSSVRAFIRPDTGCKIEDYCSNNFKLLSPFRARRIEDRITRRFAKELEEKSASLCSLISQNQHEPDCTDHIASFISNQTTFEILDLTPGASHEVQTGWKANNDRIETLSMQSAHFFLEASRDINRQWSVRVSATAIDPKGLLGDPKDRYGHKGTVVVEQGSRLHEQLEQVLGTGATRLPAAASQVRHLTHR